MLTERGRDFRPVLWALLAWGNRHFAPEGPNVVIVDGDTAYCSWRDACLVVVDVADAADPKLITTSAGFHRSAAAPTSVSWSASRGSTNGCNANSAAAAANHAAARIGQDRGLCGPLRPAKEPTEYEQHNGRHGGCQRMGLMNVR